MLKIKFSFLFFFLVSFSHAQNQVFEEKNISLTEFFVKTEVLQESTVGDRYGDVTRTDGFVINDVTKLGSMFTKRLHKSGKVIFNSEAGDYLNEIKSNLLSNYPKVDSLINVYITENGTLNAFATVNNNIYINIGLLARVENEAQLAFILSHEIMHIVNNHIINQSLNENQKAKEYDKNDTGIDDDILQLYRHELSQSHETEADIDGFSLFSKQNYDPIESKKALELLKNANDYTIDIPINEDVLFMPALNQFEILLKQYKSNLEEEKTKDDPEYKTHPLIEERIAELDKLYEDVDSLKKNSVKYIVSKDLFESVNTQAKKEINKIFSEDLDFISLFLFSSSRLTTLNDTTKENLNYLGYSIQGLLIDKIKEIDIGTARSTNLADSILSYFFKKTDNDEFYKWTFDAIKKLKQDFPSQKLDRYYNMIVQTIVNQNYASAEYIFGAEHENIDYTKVNNVKGLNIDNLTFNVSPWADMTRKQVKSYNETEVYSTSREGKVAIVNTINVSIKKDNKFMMDYVVDSDKNELLDYRTDKAWLDIEECRNDKVVSLTPNPINYNGNDYFLYDQLNQWMTERLYFDGYDYVSIHEDDVDKIYNDNSIRYALTSLNVEVKSFSLKTFIASYFAPFVMFHYMPQLVMNISNASTRKYQLTLIFDVKNKELSFWDKKTYVDPNTKAQLQMVYDNLIKDFYNE